MEANEILPGGKTVGGFPDESHNTDFQSAGETPEQKKISIPTSTNLFDSGADMDIEVKSRVAAHDALIDRFPGIPEEYDDELNKLFINFIFSKNHGRTKECICTSCYGRFEIRGADQQIWSLSTQGMAILCAVRSAENH